MSLTISQEIERRMEAFADAVGGYAKACDIIDRLNAEGWTLWLTWDENDAPAFLAEEGAPVKRPPRYRSVK